ncbi:MAG: aldo/keto reductase [Burkholderiales bacterium]|nr:aldo/keto reductase [Burkholderiales bacterium]
MKQVVLPGGERVPALGQGTWHIGDDAGTRAEEIAALRAGLDLGLSVIDTAEMYGDGAAEALVGAAIAGRRDDAFLVSKVTPHNATRRGVVAACERSLARLRTDRIDLYLLHWRGSVPFAETIAGFQDLLAAGKIRHFGVSNLDLADMRAWWATPGGAALAANQILYNLARRGPEWDLLPWLAARRVPVMAYSPLEQARLLGHPGLVAFARAHALTPAQAALAWLLRRDDTIVIPKTGRRARLRENAAAAQHVLDAPALAALDRVFAPPRAARPLEML